MREQQLGPELDSLDEDRMVGHYGRDRPPDLARSGYQTAVRILADTVAKGSRPIPRKQLAETVLNVAGRYVWYTMYPIVEGLLTEQGRLFRKGEAPGNPTAPHGERRPCYDRDHLWLQWHDQGLKPKEIQKRWNTEYRQRGGEKIAPNNSGRVVIKEGLKKARKERQEGK